MQDNHTTVLAADPVALLKWHIDVGADEAIAETPVDRTVQAPPAAVSSLAAVPSVAGMPVVTPAVMATFAAMPPKTQPDTAPPSELCADARKLAEACQTLEDLKAALLGFDACPLKRTATNMVFADGNPKARLMLIGDAPGADEDRLGKPFAGEAGLLLDKMLAAIGHSREDTYITNIINWRPPGNRDPSDAEIMMCLPFIRRHIELVKPEVLFFIGGVSAKALLETSQGIARIRGQWRDYKSDGLSGPIPCIASYHPESLLRTPAHKALAWKDLLAIKARLSVSAP